MSHKTEVEAIAFEAGQQDVVRQIVAYLYKLAEERQRTAYQTGNTNTGLLASDAIAISVYIQREFQRQPALSRDPVGGEPK